MMKPEKTAVEKAALLTETYGIPSVQYALIDDGEIVVSGQAGKNDLNDNIPLTSNTVYGVGSTSKVVLAAAVMKLVDEGKVDLDLPIENYNIIGTGGIYSTAEDLVKFSQIFTEKNKGILSKESITAMEQEEYKKGMWPEYSDASFAYG
ncbi:serine hydrolase [Paenibacillus sp. MER TA 81-3]|uniref:serine hydrolase domain-containing protein n=1 Tax=Paenibacillus sp. MER TA 81-3 TaxID=2939573 RepID=UPI00288C41D6|nr:serine hydrolase [Paenibacillus sp. MER TA 81-3]